MRVSHLLRFSLIGLLLIGGIAVAQQQGPLPAPALKREAPPQEVPAPAGDQITIPAGTTIPLRLTQSISTKNARPGDPVFSQTTFPVTMNDRIVIPPGSYVQGVIDEVKRAGRVKGRAEILVHFRTLILPSGYTISLGGAVEGWEQQSEGQRGYGPGKWGERQRRGNDRQNWRCGSSYRCIEYGNIKGRSHWRRGWRCRWNDCNPADAGQRRGAAHGNYGGYGAGAARHAPDEQAAARERVVCWPGSGLSLARKSLQRNHTYVDSNNFPDGGGLRSRRAPGLV